MRRLLFLIILLPLIADVNATHILGGEIKYVHLNGLTYSITMRYWTDLSAPADRPELVMDLGDGSVDTVPRNLIVDDPAGTDCGAIRYAEYVTTHTYPGLGTYTIRIFDQNRNGGIVNVPNSVSQPFSISALLVIDPIFGTNSSIHFTTTPIDVDWSWSTLVHDPGPTDPDGDSLSFELVTPEGFGGMPIVGYSLPDQFTAPGGFVWIDPGTGVFQWHLPNLLGEFVIAIRASEWRNGMLIGQVTRDMTICLSSVPTAVPEMDVTTDLLDIRTGPKEWVAMNNSNGPLRGELIDAQGRLVRSIRLLQGPNEIAWDGIPSGAFVLTATAVNGYRTMHRLIRP